MALECPNCHTDFHVEPPRYGVLTKDYFRGNRDGRNNFRKSPPDRWP